MSETITAVVQDTTFRNNDNSYTVLRVRIGDNEHTVVGPMPELRCGENVVFTGSWTDHPVYGSQFSATSCTISVPQGKNEIINYLGSGMIKGIRLSTATKIVNHFGENTLQILDENPDRLREIPGIGKKRVEQIKEQYIEQMGMRRIVLYLQKYGFSLTMISNITKRYKMNTIEIIRENPYRMVTEIDGIGFLTADKMALSMGFDPQSDFRLRAALFYTLNEASSNGGHTFLPKDELVSTTSELLRADKELIERQLIQCLLAKKLIAFEMLEYPEAICLPQFYYSETEIAYRLLLLKTHTAPAPIAALNQKIARYEKALHIQFSELQKQAIRTAVTEGTMVITGGPGTGKTTIIRCIMELLSTNHDTIVLCAPTGRAAKRMSEASGAEAKTIHRLLEYDVSAGEFSVNEENPLNANCVIIDEMSMVDVLLMRSLLRAITPGTRLIMVGDSNQLPSVGAGNVLSDILTSEMIPTVQLKDIYRQNDTSMIVWNAHLINNGEMPILRNRDTDFFFEKHPWQSEASTAISTLMSDRLPRYLKLQPHNLHEILRNIQVLSPTKKGDCGSVTLNKILQNALNPETDGKGSLIHGSMEFREGDKVIQTKNNYELQYTRVLENSKSVTGSGVFNGDVGYIEAIEPSENMLTVRFDDDRVAIYQKGQLDELSLAYCLTVHKSQGSEFPVVILPVVGGPPMLMARNLLYTALTRAKKLVVLVGREDVIHQMVDNNHVAKRFTTLKERLRTVEHL